MSKSAELQVELDNLPKFAPDVYSKLDLNRLTAYGISVLKERRIPVTIETLVVALFKMFPQKFSLVGFPQYPDATRVNRALLQLRPKYRNWGMGSVKLGFSLTERGKEEVERTKLLLENPTLQRPVNRAKPQRTRALDAEVSRVESSETYLKFLQGKIEDMNERDVLGLLGVFSYSPRERVRDWMKTLQGHANLLGKSKVLEFLREIEKRFPHIFRRGSDG